MSNTDKDRPYWVRVRDFGIIKHDHRHGECVIESRDSRGTSWREFNGSHRRHCAKRSVVIEHCTKAEPFVSHRYAWRYGYDWNVQTCWTWVCTCPIPETWRTEPHGCTSRERVGCVGHRRTLWDNSTPCVCDDVVRETCTFTEPDSWRYSCFGGGGVPSEYVAAVYHRPERQRERRVLRDALRSFNAGEDLEDFDFVNRQGRSSARWLYH